MSELPRYRPEPDLWVVIAHDDPLADGDARTRIASVAQRFAEAAGGVVVAEATYPETESLPDLGSRHLRMPNPSYFHQRERLLNLAIAEVPDDVEFVAWIEAGAVLMNQEWMTSCVKELRQGWDLVRLFDRPAVLEKRDCDVCRRDGGFAFAARRDEIRRVGLYDRSITGDNPRLIVHGLGGGPRHGCITDRLGHGTPPYRDYEAWSTGVGSLRCTSLPGVLRRPGPDRSGAGADAALAVRQIRFDPVIDLESAPDGTWRIRPERDDLRDWLRAARLDLIPAPPNRREDLGRALTLVNRAEYDAGRSLLMDILRSGHAPSRCLRGLGLIARMQQDHESAAAFCEEALSYPGADYFAHLDLADNMQRLECDEWLPAAELACFAAEVDDRLLGENVERLEVVADDRYDGGRLEEAQILYGVLVGFRPEDDVSRFALAECHLRRGDAPAALAALEAGEPVSLESAEWTRLRAEIHLRLGHVAASAAALRRLAASGEPDAATLRLLIEAMTSAGAADLRAVTALADELPGHEAFEMKLRVALHGGDWDRIAALYQDADDDLAAAGDGVLLEEVGRRTSAGDFVGIGRLLGITGRTHPVDNDLLLAVTDAAIAARDWDRAGELLTFADDVWVSDDDGPILTRRLMVDCLRLDLDAAAERVESWPEIPLYATTAVCTLYAALGRWDDVLALFRDAAERGLNVSSDPLLVAVAKAARHTDRYDDALAATDAALAIWPLPVLRFFRDRLIGDAAVAAAAGRKVDPRVTGQPIGKSSYADRIARVTRTLTAGAPRPDPNVVYFCTDGNYLIGALVAISSMLRNNPGIARNTTVRLVGTDDAIAAAEPVLTQLGDSIGATIEMLPADALEAASQVLRTSWGAFTPGHGLSDAAYYRIHAASKLLRDGTHGRALYIDSDVIVGPGVERLLATDLSDQPLGVRRELPLPEILAAARKLGVPDEAYFNSGVLLFDLDHPALADCLARSLDFAVHKPELLSFVDQCALNIGFLGRVAWLPAEGNYFLREPDPWTLGLEPTVLHFLASPKPWDPSYRSRHADRWVREFEILGRTVDPAVLRPAVAAMFPAQA